MNIKVQGLLNATKWIEEEFGSDALRDVLSGCGPAVRDRCASGISSDWHPREEFIELVASAEKVCGVGRVPGKVAEGIGAAGARVNVRATVVRLAAWILRPEHLLQRLTWLWKHLNDEGAMHVLDLGDTGAHLEVTGLKEPNTLFCSVISGWCREVAILIHANHPVVRHSTCRTRGDDRCIWEVRYESISASASKESRK